MGGIYDAPDRGRDWFAIKARKRILLVVAIAIGFVLATPSFAFCPKPTEMFVARTPSAAKMWAKMQMAKYGWNSKADWNALVQLWTNESHWRCSAYNKTPVYLRINNKWVKFYAGGIPQRIGLSPKTNVKKQIQVGLDYIQERYGSPGNALRFWNAHYWY
jgi:hypothetical protein